VRISGKPIYAQADLIDALVVFSWEDFARFRSELALAPDAVVLHDSEDAVPDWIVTARVTPVHFPKTGKNIFALGLLASIFGLPADAIRAAVAKRFAKKSAAVLESNREAFDNGFTLG